MLTRIFFLSCGFGIEKSMPLTSLFVTGTSSEPSDSIRVVNALLTQLDSISHYPNVLVLTTSNITGAIDLAFVDRADIKQYIGPPSRAAIYVILSSCIVELKRQRAKLLTKNHLKV